VAKTELEIVLATLFDGEEGCGIDTVRKDLTLLKPYSSCTMGTN
jgi:hypothetical protein